MNNINSRRIAKNTLYLYLRMLLVMFVSLFTVRIVLNALGAEDYGINNVVGGFVTLFAFLSSTLNSASLRFFSYSIGQKNYCKLSEYFTMSFWCYVLLAFIIIILAETIGLWFVYYKLTIPEERLSAAIIVYQCSILSFGYKLMTVPYNSLVIAHERMNLYAILGILECLSKLAVTYLLYISPFDKLITYTVLWTLMTIAIDSYYIIYGLKHFKESRIKRFWNSSVFKEIANYSGWSLFGAVADVIRGQGINILLNIFFNPVVNAARAIAFQVNGQINQFVLNFYKAVQPQLTKSYGAGDIVGLHSLVFRSSRFCYYLILILSLPVLFESNYILTLWLKNLPDNTVLFTRLVILNAVIDSISYPLQTCISATGKIRLYQFLTGGLLILNLPMAWLLLRYGYPPEITMYISIVVSIAAQGVRLLFVKEKVHLSVRKYFYDVLLRICVVTFLSIVIPSFVFVYMNASLSRFILVVFSCIISCILSIWIVGITQNERVYFIGVIKKKLHLST